MKYWCNIFPFFCRGVPLGMDVATFDIIKNLKLVINVRISFSKKKQVWISMHYLLRVELFFSKQYNKSALLHFLLGVWDCVMCTPGASSPSKKAKEASGDEPSSPAAASLHDCSFAIGSGSFLSASSCFQLPLHPSVLWVSGSKFTQRGFPVVYVLHQMWGTKRDLNSHLVFSAPWTLDYKCVPSGTYGTFPAILTKATGALPSLLLPERAQRSPRQHLSQAGA